MIRRTFSSLASFKAMTFKPGFNIVLADKGAESTDLQTRNGAGKMPPLLISLDAYKTA